MIDISDSLTISIMSELDILISKSEALNIPKLLTIQLKLNEDSFEIAKMIEQQYNCTVLIN
jgi:hypothetical protein